jgi:hypothetical protein
VDLSVDSFLESKDRVEQSGESVAVSLDSAGRIVGYSIDTR